MCILITTLSPGLVSRVRERARLSVAPRREREVEISAAGKWRNGWVCTAGYTYTDRLWLSLAVPLGWLLLDESTGAEDLMEDIGTGPPARRLIRTLENR